MVADSPLITPSQTSYSKSLLRCISQECVTLGTLSASWLSTTAVTYAQQPLSGHAGQREPLGSDHMRVYGHSVSGTLGSDHQPHRA